MKRFLPLFLAIALGAPAQAADRVPATHQLALDYLQAVNMEAIVTASEQQVEQGLFKKVPLAEQGKVHAIIDGAVGWAATRDQLAELVASLYTAAELKAYIAFVRSPEGKSFNAKNEEFTQRYGAIVSARMQAAMKECCSQSRQGSQAPSPSGQ